MTRCLSTPSSRQALLGQELLNCGPLLIVYITCKLRMVRIILRVQKIYIKHVMARENENSNLSDHKQFYWNTVILIMTAFMLQCQSVACKA